MQRLDKILSEAGVASRKELKDLIRSGRVCVNGNVIRKPETKAEPTDTILVDGEPIGTMRSVVLMMNKPVGFVTSTDEPGSRTVMELVPEEYRRLGVVPAGRLDKDTEGMLILTNDGAFAHRLISPRRHVKKVYEAVHEGCAGADDVEAFAAGMILKDGTQCLPALLEPMEEHCSRITLEEGKYHQVRRMMAARGMHVNELRRLSVGKLTLDGLELGKCREIPEEEQKLLEP